MQKMTKKMFVVPLMIAGASLFCCSNACAGLVYGKIMGEFGDNSFFTVTINGAEERVFVSRERSYRVHLPPGNFEAVSGDRRFRGMIMSYPQPYELNLYFYPTE